MPAPAFEVFTTDVETSFTLNISVDTPILSIHKGKHVTTSEVCLPYRQQHKHKDLFNDTSIVTACVNCMPHREIFNLKDQLGLRNNNNNCYLNSLTSVYMSNSQYIQLNEWSSIDILNILDAWTLYRPYQDVSVLSGIYWQEILNFY